MPKTVPRVPQTYARSMCRTPGRHSMGGVPGLYLLVKKPRGWAEPRSYWVLRIVVHGKRVDLGLGPGDVLLSVARERARKAHDMIWRGATALEVKEALRAGTGRLSSTERLERAEARAAAALEAAEHATADSIEAEARAAASAARLAIAPAADEVAEQVERLLLAAVRR